MCRDECQDVVHPPKRGMKSIKVEERRVESFDGTDLAYHVVGQGAPILLANGLGGSWKAWQHQISYFEDRYRFVSWDYRGLYRSGAPPNRDAVSIEDHAADALAVLDAEGIEQTAIFGWSMGVQVALETIRHHAPRVKGMVAINGTYGRTFRSVMGSQLVGRTIPVVVKLLRAQAAFAGFAARRIAGSQALVAAMQRAGLVSRDVDVEHFRAVAAGFCDVDWVIYSDLMARLDEHDAEAVLATVNVPLTIVTGDQDRLIPASASEHMHRAIAGSRLVVVEGGTHYTPVEFPDVIVDEVGRLLDRVPGWQRR